MYKHILTLSLLFVTIACRASQTTSEEREAIRVLQAQHDVAMATLSPIRQKYLDEAQKKYEKEPQVVSALALEKEISDKIQILENKCKPLSLGKDPGKPNEYLRCAEAPAKK